MSNPRPDIERRAFYRHPVRIPIQVFPQSVPGKQVDTKNLSIGGLAFQTCTNLEKGDVIKIKISFANRPEFEAACVVCWQQKLTDSELLDVGVKFLDEETSFKARMVEQICHIQDYQKQQEEDGRELTFAEAAKEWIEKFAGNFHHIDK